jgi:hypothetical protein
MLEIELKILGTLEVSAQFERPSIPNSRAGRALLTLFGARQEYPRSDLIDALWPNDPNRDEWDGSHAGLNTGLKEARRGLGLAGPRLESRTPTVFLRWGEDPKTQTRLTTDYMRFLELVRSSRHEDLRAAIRMTRGEIGTGLETTGFSPDWLARPRDRQRRALLEAIAALMPSERAPERVLEEILDFGGASVLAPDKSPAVPQRRRPFREIDLHELGVHPVALSGIPRSPLPRPHIDAPLDRAVSAAAAAAKSGATMTPSERFVLLEGVSLAGKTRAMTEAALRNGDLRDVATLAPDPLDHVAVADAVAEATEAREPLLLWLDDIDGFIGYETNDQGVSPARLKRALETNPQLVVLATAGGKGHHRIDPREHAHRFGGLWQDIVGLAAHRVTASSTVVRPDLTAAKTAGWPLAALTSIETVGLGAAVCAGPQLVEALEAMRETDANGGWAAASCVGLLQQEGWFLGPVPERVVEVAWRELTGRRASNGRGWRDALDHATTPMLGETRIVSSVPQGLTVHDYVRPRLTMSGQQRFQILQGAASAMTAAQCADAPWEAATNDLAAVTLALRCAEAGNDAAAAVLHNLVSDARGWPADLDDARACVALILRVASVAAEAIVAPYTLAYLAGLPEPLFFEMVAQITNVSNGDLIAIGITLLRDGRSAEARVEMAAQPRLSGERRKQLAMSLSFLLGQMRGPSSEWHFGARDEADLMAAALLTTDDDSVRVELRTAFASYLELGGELALSNLFVDVQGSHRVPDKKAGAERAIEELDALTARDGTADEPLLAINAALLALWADPDSNAQQTLRMLSNHPSPPIAATAAQDLFAFLERYGDHEAATQLLEQLTDPFARAKCLARELVNPQRFEWLGEQAGLAEAIVLHRIVSGTDRREACDRARSALKWATPDELSSAVSLAGDGGDVGELNLHTDATDRDLARELVAHLARYSRTSAYVPDAILDLCLGDPGDISLAAAIENAIRAGRRDGLHALETVAALSTDELDELALREFDQEVTRELAELWDARLNCVLAPVWEWAASLSTRGEEEGAPSDRVEHLTLF